MGNQAADLSRELETDLFVHVEREDPVGLKRRADVLRHFAAHLRRLVGREVIKDLGLEILVAGELASLLDSAARRDLPGRFVRGLLLSGARPAAALRFVRVSENPRQHGRTPPRAIASDRVAKGKHA